MEKLSMKIGSGVAAVALGGALAVSLAPPALANTLWGPYSDRASCQADRTQAMYDTSSSATSCTQNNFGWYFILWD